MVQLIASIIFIVSLGGFLFLLYRKIPALVQLPQNGHHGIKKHEAIIKIERRINHWYTHFFEKQVPMQKLLSKFRIFILKTERIIDQMLHGIRKKAQQVDKDKK